MSNAKMTIDNHARAPDSGYQRTDEELAHQAAYEARERNLHTSTVQVVYRVEKVRPDPGPIARKLAWVVIRRVNDEKEQTSAQMYRLQETVSYIRESLIRDREAAKRLGVGIHTSVK
jgi:hypothetical protein